MTQLQIDHAVASATGESLDLVRQRGFGLVSPGQHDLAPEGFDLAVACPFCRRAVAYPGRTRDGALPLAECLACDVYFAIAPEQVFLVRPDRA